MEETIVSIILTSLAGFLTVYITHQLNKPKTRKEIEKTEADAEKTRIESAAMVAEEWADYAKELKDKVAQLKSDLEAAENKIIELEAMFNDLRQELHRRNTALVDMLRSVWLGVSILMEQIRNANMTPDWEPDKQLVKDIKKELKEFDDE